MPIKFIEFWIKQIVSEVSTFAIEKLKYKSPFSFVLDVAGFTLGCYALSVVLSLGWQANVECQTFKPLVEQAKACADKQDYPKLDCIHNFKGMNKSYSPLYPIQNSSYWYEQPNGKQFNLPKNSLIGGLVK